MELYYNAFCALSGDRGAFGGPVSWLAIQKYCERHEFDEDQEEALVYHLRAMDEIVSEVKDVKKNG